MPSDYIRGIDVSKWQAEVDWTKVAAAGMRFAFIRSSYGVTGVDRFFAANWAGAKAAGLLRGAYHFAYVSDPIETDAVAEADKMFAVVGKLAPGDLPPVLDIEWGGVKGYRAPEILAWSKVFLARAQVLFERTPIVYTGPSFWRFKLAKTEELIEFPLWQVEYVDRPLPTPMGKWAWLFWQHSSRGRVDGVNGNVDINRFRGSEADLRKLAGLSAEADPVVPTPKVPTPPGPLGFPSVQLHGRAHAEAVRRVQALLLAHGYGPAGLVDESTGQPDGVAGRRTRAAVAEFKQAYGLPGDPAQIDDATWWTLLAAGLSDDT